MKIVMIAGSHPRHLYIANLLAETGMLAGIVMEKREKMILDIPLNLKDDLRELYIHHFKLRLDMEEKYFGQGNIDHLIKNIPTCVVEEKNLNSGEVVEFIKKIKADTLISYGPGLIHKEIIDLCDGKAFNVHGGLSPYYKGSATMFWPFYFLEPNFVGTTIHYITNRIDGGAIVHQTVPKLEHGDCMHEVSCKAIIEMGKDLTKFVEIMKSEREIAGRPQKKNGKLFLSKDWRPEHLNLIYNTYEDRITDMYLDGEINCDNEPELVKAW